jgi:hypothetical protein
VSGGGSAVNRRQSRQRTAEYAKSGQKQGGGCVARRRPEAGIAGTTIVHGRNSSKANQIPDFRVDGGCGGGHEP